MTGSPEPPPPYRTVRVFPKLQFKNPVELVFSRELNRFVLLELGGKILAFQNNPAIEKPDLCIDMARTVDRFRRAYGIAFHPRFKENRYVYVCYVIDEKLPDGTHVSRFTMKRGDPPTLDPSTEKILITWYSGGHNGGSLQFGPDGFLYISAGDGGPAFPPDPDNTGQDISDLLSSILRIDVDREDGGKPYAIPEDNPFHETPGARAEVWAYGLRNPWKMSFDRES